MKHRFTNTLATGLTSREWDRLIKYYRTHPDAPVNQPTIAEACAAATAAAGRKRRTALPTTIMREAKRITQARALTNPEPNP